MPKNILPNDTWLKANGYNGLVKARKDRPELFSTVQEPQPVSERAIIKRINRVLVADGERLGINRTGHARYRHMNINPSAVLGDFSDLESFARECGVMTFNETIKN